MTDFEKKENYNVYDLERIIDLLRSENGCPWDKEQTHESIRRNMLEEAYEVCEAIDDDDSAHLCEELGDVMMQVVFHASIEKDKGAFTLDDVADMVCKKLIDRHPHVFGDVIAKTSEEVLDNWDIIKMRERSQTSVSDTMDSVAKSLPALWRADKIISKAEKAGFKLSDPTQAADKLVEEANRLKKAVYEGSDAYNELGDTLFAAAEVSRYLNVDPEYALGHASDEFIKAFRYAEDEAEKSGTSLRELDREGILSSYKNKQQTETLTTEDLK